MAPSAMSMRAFSTAASSGMHTWHRTPTAGATVASETPVLPAVPSVIVPPALRTRARMRARRYPAKD